MATPPHELQSATLLYLLTTLTRKSTESGEESWKRKSDQEGSTGLFVQIMTYKFGSKI